MAGYKIQGKTESGAMVDIPLAATYDGSGREISATYAEKTAASHGAAGLMSAADKIKIDGIESGAQKNTVVGVKGNSETNYRTGSINITKGNIGLSNVDNTSDANKPVSTAQQAAIDAAKTAATETAGTNADVKINTHNANTSAHSDIRKEISDIEVKLSNDYDTSAEVDEKISSAISAVTDGAPAAFDTLKEVAQWIENDETGTDALVARVAQNEEDIHDLEENAMKPEDLSAGVTSTSTLSAGANATATAQWDKTNKKINFSFGIPKGDPGIDGDNGLDGSDGEEGLGIWHSSYSGSTTTTSISLSTITVPEGRSVKVGDLIIANSTYSRLYRVTAVSSTTATVTYLQSLRGAPGEDGRDGNDGYNGQDGEEGLGIWRSSTATSTTTTSITKSTITVPTGRSIKVGDLIIANSTYSYLYRVTAVNSSTVTVTYLQTLRGAAGTDATTTSVATTSANGLMSSSDKTKLNGIDTGATANNIYRGTSSSRTSNTTSVSTLRFGFVSSTGTLYIWTS